VTRAVVVVPWRSRGDQRRQANLVRVHKHLIDVGIPVVTVDDGRIIGPFNRHAAYNRGRFKLLNVSCFVWHEADMLVPKEQLHDAVTLALEAPGLVVPFDTYGYLTDEDSARVLAGADYRTMTPEWSMHDGASIGAVGVTSAETMNLVTRWDEQFEGHGYDDRAMKLAFDKAAGPTRFVAGYGWHLWHPVAYSPWLGDDPNAHDSADVVATQRNKRRLRLYERAVTGDDVRKLTSG
jgi:hypothetical protein